MIPVFTSNPESMIKVRVITVKDKLERTVKTLYKAGTLDIEISEELEALIYTSLEKELRITCDSPSPYNDIIIYVQAKKHAYLADHIKLMCFRPFRESDIQDGSVAVNWN